MNTDLLQNKISAFWDNHRYGNTTPLPGHRDRQAVVAGGGHVYTHGWQTVRQPGHGYQSASEFERSDGGAVFSLEPEIAAEVVAYHCCR